MMIMLVVVNSQTFFLMSKLLNLVFVLSLSLMTNKKSELCCLKFLIFVTNVGLAWLHNLLRMEGLIRVFLTFANLFELKLRLSIILLLVSNQAVVLILIFVLNNRRANLSQEGTLMLRLLCQTMFKAQSRASIAMVLI